jgi:predicted metal-dependent phosphoesterase TrpH
MAAVRIDLHVHSNASDGTDAPAEVIRRAAAAGLDVLALTDHDTQAGIAGARAALPPGLALVPGMELSCQLDLPPAGGRPPQTPPSAPAGGRPPQGPATAPAGGQPPQGPATRSVHLLAYLFDPEDPALRAETAQIRDDRTYRAKAMVGKMRELGADVTWEQVSAIADGAVVGRPHLARALAASGAVPAPADAFTADWIADGGRAFVDRYAPGLARAVRLVLAAGGVPVLAHPRSPGYEVPDEVIAELAGAGLRGIEVFHRDHDAAQRSQLTRLARSLNLIMTGGSDDHGAFNNSGLGSETTPPEEYARLLAQASPARAN